MYLESEHQSIGDADEYIFTLAGESPNAYPTLVSLRSRFYSQFNLGPTEAERLVHELLGLYAEYASTAGRGLAPLTLKLACFFSRASVDGTSIRCAGD